MPMRDLDRICEIAARLHEQVNLLRKLGAHDAADLVAAAEACLDNQVYAEAGDQSELNAGDALSRKLRRLFPLKPGELGTH